MVLVVAVPLAFAAALYAIDKGWADRPIKSWISHKLGREVRFDGLEAHLLSPVPTIRVRNLMISNTNWAGGGDLAEIAQVTATVRPWSIFRGQLDVTALQLESPMLNLIRGKSGQRNWVLGHPKPGERAFGFLRGVAGLSITNGRMTLRDLQQGCEMRGRFDHRGGLSLPFHLKADGTLRGATFILAGVGGPLNGPSVERPYPFLAEIIDGKTVIDARGTSGQPFDLYAYDLAIALHGPNLADLSYLFNLQTPNSAPFTLTTRAIGTGPQVRFERLKGRIGASDVAGSINSDQSTSRHRVKADLRFGRWTKADIEASLATLPPHSSTRAISGASAIGKPSRWLLSDAPFPVDRLRAIDVDSRIEAQSLEGYTAPLTDVRAHVVLDHGRLIFSDARGRIFGGELSGNVVLNARSPTPEVNIKGELRGAEMGKAPALSANGVRGRIGAQFLFVGQGASFHGAAAHAKGHARVEIGPGLMLRPAAFLLGGDLLRAAVSLGDTRRAVSITCAAATFTASTGQFRTDDLLIQTPAGMTAGNGMIDLANERLTMTLTGHPTKKRLFQVAMPVKLDGPLARPTASLLPGANARKLGISGKLGILLSPVAAVLPLGADTRPRPGCS
jgi:uncharacterized protein involved in outer membrane biogenesis